MAERYGGARCGKRMTRRAFIGTAVAGLLSACAGTEVFTEPAVAAPTLIRQTLVPPTSTPVPTAPPTLTAVPDPTQAAATASPSATAAPAGVAGVRPLDSAGSRVVVARHSSMAAEGALDQEVLLQVLDAAVAHMTGIQVPDAAWRSLFRPEERVAIKVNTIAGSDYWTRPVLVDAVVARLVSVGLAAEQIVVFDRDSGELDRAGFQVSRDGPGARCYGTDRAYSVPTRIGSGDISFSDILVGCDALINMPILKTHSITGISFALKNHYGSIDRPGALHNNIAQVLPALNAADLIRTKTRLVVGDALAVVKSSWSSAVAGNALVVSRDPIASDAIGLQLWGTALEPERDLAQTSAYRQAAPWLEAAAALGLGQSSVGRIDRVDVQVG